MHKSVHFFAQASDVCTSNGYCRLILARVCLKSQPWLGSSSVHISIIALRTGGLYSTLHLVPVNPNPHSRPAIPNCTPYSLHSKLYTVKPTPPNPKLYSGLWRKGHDTLNPKPSLQKTSLCQTKFGVAPKFYNSLHTQVYVPSKKSNL